MSYSNIPIEECRCYSSHTKGKPTPEGNSKKRKKKKKGRKKKGKKRKKKKKKKKKGNNHTTKYVANLS